MCIIWTDPHSMCVADDKCLASLTFIIILIWSLHLLLHQEFMSTNSCLPSGSKKNFLSFLKFLKSLRPLLFDKQFKNFKKSYRPILMMERDPLCFYRTRGNRNTFRVADITEGSQGEVGSQARPSMHIEVD